MSKLRFVAFIAAALGLHGLGVARAEPIKISTITDATEPSSAEMIKLFRQKIGEHAKLFRLVSNNDASAGLIFQADCMARKANINAYVCFYTLHYSGTSNKTLMGGGVNTAKTADEIADGFLASIAQDIAEGMSHAVRTNAVENLESCLFLTQSSCAVPEVLIVELKAKTLNLSQYLQKGGLKK